jgi:hypothetical protein
VRLKRAADNTGIEVVYAGPRQNFWPRLIARGVSEGWLSMGSGKIVVHTLGSDVVYRIVRVPGKYGSEVLNWYECEKE